MNSKVLLRVIIVLVYISLLFSLAGTLSLSYYEVKNFYDEHSILYYPLQLVTSLFGHSDLALRAFMLILHLLTLYIYFLISRHYLIRERETLWNIIVFILLPAIVSSAIIVHPSGLILLLLLLFIYSYLRWQEKAIVLLPLYLFVDISFFILFLGLFVYFLKEKKWWFAALQIVLMTGSIMMFSFIGQGVPVNHFTHTFGVTSLIFSPMIFVYYLYTLVRVGARGEKDLIWTLSSVAFIFMTLLSIRQWVKVEYFAPYLIILLPLMIKQFMHTYRIRIRALRRNYKILFVMAVLFLLANSLTVYLNKYLYYFLDKPQEHFLYKHYIAKELADQLKKRGYEKLNITDRRMRLRLKFYGIEHDLLAPVLRKNSCKNVTISYSNIKITSFCVTKRSTLEDI